MIEGSASEVVRLDDHRPAGDRCGQAEHHAAAPRHGVSVLSRHGDDERFAIRIEAGNGAVTATYALAPSSLISSS
jgi:hypothetical protein